METLKATDASDSSNVPMQRTFAERSTVSSRKSSKGSTVNDHQELSEKDRADDARRNATDSASSRVNESNPLASFRAICNKYRSVFEDKNERPKFSLEGGGPITFMIVLRSMLYQIFNDGFIDWRIFCISIEDKLERMRECCERAAKEEHVKLTSLKHLSNGATTSIDGIITIKRDALNGVYDRSREDSGVALVTSLIDILLHSIEHEHEPESSGNPIEFSDCLAVEATNYLMRTNDGDRQRRISELSSFAHECGKLPRLVQDCGKALGEIYSSPEHHSLSRLQLEEIIRVKFRVIFLKDQEFSRVIFGRSGDLEMNTKDSSHYDVVAAPPSGIDLPVASPSFASVVSKSSDVLKSHPMTSQSPDSSLDDKLKFIDSAKIVGWRMGEVEYPDKVAPGDSAGENANNPSKNLPSKVLYGSGGLAINEHKVGYPAKNPGDVTENVLGNASGSTSATTETLNEGIFEASHSVPKSATKDLARSRIVENGSSQNVDDAPESFAGIPSLSSHVINVEGGVLLASSHRLLDFSDVNAKDFEPFQAFGARFEAASVPTTLEPQLAAFDEALVAALKLRSNTEPHEDLGKRKKKKHQNEGETPKRETLNTKGVANQDEKNGQRKKKKRQTADIASSKTEASQEGGNGSGRKTKGGGEKGSKAKKRGKKNQASVDIVKGKRTKKDKATTSDVSPIESKRKRQPKKVREEETEEVETNKRKKRIKTSSEALGSNAPTTTTTLDEAPVVTAVMLDTHLHKLSNTIESVIQLLLPQYGTTASPRAAPTIRLVDSWWNAVRTVLEDRNEAGMIPMLEVAIKKFQNRESSHGQLMLTVAWMLVGEDRLMLGFDMFLPSTLSMATLLVLTKCVQSVCTFLDNRLIHDPPALRKHMRDSIAQVFNALSSKAPSVVQTKVKVLPSRLAPLLEVSNKIMPSSSSSSAPEAEEDPVAKLQTWLEAFVDLYWGSTQQAKCEELLSTLRNVSGDASVAEISTMLGRAAQCVSDFNLRREFERLARKAFNVAVSSV